MSKALEMDVLRPRDIEVVGGGDGPPRVPCTARWRRARRSSASRSHISLTHTKSTAGAVAVLR